MPRLLSAPVLLALGAAAPVMSAWAQQTPDAGTLLRELERRPALPLPRGAGTPVAPTADAAPTEAALTVQVDAFRLTGATLVPDDELQAALAPFRGRRLSFGALQKAADAVAEAYRRRGYLVRSYLPEQDLNSGSVTIAIIEGRLGELRIDSGSADGTRLRESTVKRFILSRQQLGEAIQADELQRGINLLNDLPGVKADLVLEPGAKDGESRAVVRVRDEPLLSGLAQVDNTGVHSTGSLRALANLSLDDALGFGDQGSVTALKTEHSTYGRVAVALPLGGRGLRVGASASELSYGYGTGNTWFEGVARITGLSLTQPLRRGNDGNLTLSASADAKRFRNSAGGNELNDKRAHVAALSLSGDRVDGVFGGGLTQAGLVYANGRLDLSRNAGDQSNDQTSGALRDGHFDKWLWSLSRLQQITARQTGWLALSGQRAGKNLDSAEQFGIGGPSGVRAYASGEASGDDGWLVNAEWRVQAAQALQLSGFYDRGNVRRNHHAFTGSPTPNSVTLSGVGAGANWRPGHDLVFNASVAWRVGSNPQRDPSGLDSDGTKRNPRVFLSLSKSL